MEVAFHRIFEEWIGDDGVVARDDVFGLAEEEVVGEGRGVKGSA
jgi:hypothetical protein